MTKPSNPSAFPSIVSGHNTCPGASLRDYFAAHIAQAISGNLHMYKVDITNEDIAIRAYSVADAMLAEREKDS